MNECPYLKENGVATTDAGLALKRNATQADRIKELCLNCPYDECYYVIESDKAQVS